MEIRKKKRKEQKKKRNGPPVFTFARLMMSRMIDALQRPLHFQKPNETRKRIGTEAVMTLFLEMNTKNTTRPNHSATNAGEMK